MFRAFKTGVDFSEFTPSLSKVPEASKDEGETRWNTQTLDGLDGLDAPCTDFVKNQGCDDFEERAALFEFEASVPREWVEGFAAICAMRKPDGIHEARWQQIVNDACVFIDKWAVQAHALEWSTLEVFGVHKDAPEPRFDGKGLIASLNGRRIIAVTQDTATVSANHGGTLIIKRATAAPEDSRAALWELLE